MYVCVYCTYHVGPSLKDLDQTEIHKLLDDDFKHVQTKLVIGTYVKMFSKQVDSLLSKNQSLIS